MMVEEVVMTLDELVKQLPSSWSELKLKDFIKLLDVEINEQVADDNDNAYLNTFVGLDNTLQVVSKLTGVEVEQLEALSIYDLNRIGRKLSFLTEMPQPKRKSVLDLKKIHEVSYNDFVTFTTLSKDPLKNLAIILKAFSKKEISEEQILELDMVEAHTGFFLLKKHVNKYLRRTRVSLEKQILKERLMEQARNKAQRSKRT